MNKPFYMMPCAGLANRIRSLVSAVCAAKDLGRPLHVLWRNEPGICTAPFRTLFDSPPDGVIVEEVATYPYGPWKEIFTEEDFDGLGKDGPLWIKSHQIFYKKSAPEWFSTLRSLKIRPEILDQATIGAATIGVHIRRTDHVKAIQNSLSAAFWAKMGAYPADTIFYVASDLDTEREEAIRRFGDRVCIGPKVLLGRNSPDGCRDAFLDMVCLSKCSEIIGSYASSFGEMAAALGNVPLKIV